MHSVVLTGSNGGMYKDTHTCIHVITNQITASFNLVDFIYLMIAPEPFWKTDYRNNKNIPSFSIKA